VEDGLQLQPSAAIAVMGDLRQNHKLLLGRKKGINYICKHKNTVYGTIQLGGIITLVIRYS
jgi:hypothetical protein